MNQNFDHGSLTERLYKYLAERNCPVSIGEICGEETFSSFTRREVARALQGLAAADDLFRSMKDGRAYYSVNSNEGGKNAVQKNIDDLQKVLNGQGRVNSKIQENDPLKSENNQNKAVTEILISYMDRIIGISDSYTMQIPDGFKTLEGEDRDFAYYLPNNDIGDSDFAFIRILPVNGDMEMNESIKYRLQKSYAVYYSGVGFWGGQVKSFSLLFNDVRFMATEYGACTITVMGDTRHYYFYIYCGEKYKQIHLQFDCLSGTNEEFDQKALEIIKGVAAKEPLKELERLNDEVFLPDNITDSVVDKWYKTLEENMHEYNLLYNTEIAVEKMRMEYEREEGLLSVIKTKIRFRSYIQEFCHNLDSMCPEIIDYWEKLKKRTDDEAILLKAYHYIKEFVDENSAYTITFDDEELTESPKCLKDLERNILQKDKGLIERQIAREQEEKRKKQEEERIKRDAVEKQKRELQKKKQERKKVILKESKVISEFKNIICARDNVIAAVAKDGTIVSVGLPEDLKREVDKWTGMKGICVHIDKFGARFVIGLKENGTVVSAGDQGKGWTNVSSWRDIKQIAVGHLHTVGLKNDGTVVVAIEGEKPHHYITGYEGSVKDWEKITAIAADTRITIGLCEDGNIKCATSYDHYRSLNRLLRHDPFLYITMNDGYFYAVKSDGSIYDYSFFGKELAQPIYWSDIVMLGDLSKQEGDNLAAVGVTVDGKVRIQGWFGTTDDFDPVNSWENIIWAGYSGKQVVGLTKDGYIKVYPDTNETEELKSIRLFDNYLTIEEDRTLYKIQGKINKLQKKNEEIFHKISVLEQRMHNVKGLFKESKKNKIKNEIDGLKKAIEKNKSDIQDLCKTKEQVGMRDKMN